MLKSFYIHIDVLQFVSCDRFYAKLNVRNVLDQFSLKLIQITKYVRNMQKIGGIWKPKKKFRILFEGAYAHAENWRDLKTPKKI